jgi:CRISPR-associated endonuclease/helicase Cas3
VVNTLQTNTDIKEFFRTLTGFGARQFQIETIRKILNNRDILLRAPTGAGKTETAIAPLLFAQAFNLDFPSKLIYVVPLRTLANSLRQRTATLVNQWSSLHQLSRPLTVTLQTGENPEDPRFEGDIIFCTIDQILSSFLNIPYSVGRGSANVNSGAIFASYLVFDELHLLDPDRSFSTVIEVLQQVKGISPCLLMTATLTEELTSRIVGEINSEFNQVAGADLTEIEGNRCRMFRAVSQPLTAGTIIDDIQQHSRRRAIVICNTVAQSQGIFQDLQAADLNDNLEITLLHSRFLPEDRASKEAYLQAAFAENWLDDGKCWVLIATQVIEAGLNITCEVMHSHLCPMNSLLQRAGRCARFSGEIGEVFVYRSFQLLQFESELLTSDFEDGEVENNPQNRQNFLPYDRKICELTWQVLEEHSQSERVDRPVGFRTESEWVDRVHAAEDALQAKRRENDRAEFDRRFNAAVFQGDRSVANDLIRLVDNRSIFVWEEAGFIDFDEKQIDPKKLIPFSLPVTILYKVWREFQNLEYETAWIFKRIEYPARSRAETYDRPIATAIKSTADLCASLQILVNPRYIQYDAEVGLIIDIHQQGNGFTSPEKAKKPIASEYKYRMDNYVGHLVLMWKCWREPFVTKVLTNGTICDIKYGSVRDELLLAGGRFLQTKIFPEATAVEAAALFEYLVFLAIFTHDLGKLQVKWQEVMKGWQKIAWCEFGGRNPLSELLAHTDFDPGDRDNLDSQGRTQQQALKAWEKLHKRPNHAVESAFLGREILKQVLMPLLDDKFEADREQIQYICHGVILAAGRHHSAWATGWRNQDVAKMKPIKLHSDAQRAIDSSWRNLMRFLPKNLPFPEESPKLSRTSYEVKEFTLDRFEPDTIEYLQLYLLVVRALRLCDMRSVQF